MALVSLQCGGRGTRIEKISQFESLTPSETVIDLEETGYFVLPYSPVFERRIGFYYHGNEAVLLTRERHNGVSYEWSQSFNVPFAIEHIVDQTSENYVIGGIDEETGETVIEEWRLNTPSGGYVGNRSPAVGILPIGVPAPFTTLEVSIVDEVFIPPESRSLVEPLQRGELYRGKELVGLRRIVADPEGRYILAQDKATGSIYKICNQNLRLLAGVEDFPRLADNNWLEDFLSYGNEDRVAIVFLDSTDEESVLVMHDPDNDGLYEPPVLMTPEEAEAAFPIFSPDPYRFDFRY